MTNTDKLIVEHVERCAIHSLIQLAQLAACIFGMYFVGFFG